MDKLRHEERIKVARGIMRLLDRWGVGPEDQRTILGLPADTRSRDLRRFRDDTPLPDTPGISGRVEHLVGIADALRTACPRDPTRGALWINTAHRRFDRRTAPGDDDRGRSRRHYRGSIGVGLHLRLALHRIRRVTPRLAAAAHRPPSGSATLAAKRPRRA